MDCALLAIRRNITESAQGETDIPHSFETQPIQVERFYTGLMTQRNPLTIPIRIMGRRIIELYDAILAGGDWEISVRSTLQRRAGYIPFNTNPVTGVPQKFYAFQPTSQANAIYPIIDTTTNVYTEQPSGGAPVSLITKPQPTQSSLFAVGNYLYIGNQYFSKKWDSGTPQGITNWGIAMVNPSSNVFAYVGTASDGGGPIAWSNPANFQGAPDSAVAAATVIAPSNTTAFSNYLNGTNYGFSIGPANTVSGIQAVITGLQSLQFGGFFARAFINVYLQYNGAIISSFRGGALPLSSGTIVLGGPSDTWGASLNATIINSPTFGVIVQAVVNNGGLSGTRTCTFSLDAAQITVFQSGGPIVTPTGIGAFTATQGYQYVYAYGNSASKELSNPTLPSNSTGPFSNVNGVQVPLVASTDPQVNQIRVFRTVDTGTGSVFFELPTSPYPNTTQTITDNVPDGSLTVSSAVTSPTFAFSPPPAGLQLMEWYAGRMWGAVGNLLYFSAGPDNAPMGNGNSSWPPGNVFELPTTIVKLIPISGGNGMFVVTLDKIHIVQGITNPGFTVNVWNPDIGARQQNAVDSDGSTIYIFTSDRQYLQVSAAGINELSQFVSDITDTYDPTQVYVVQHRSGSQDSRVFLSNGSTQILPYNLMAGAWEGLQTPVDGGGVGAIGSIEITPGIYKFLKGATTSGRPVLQRDQNTFADNGQQYTWGATFGNIPVADPTQLANVDSMVLRMTNAGNLPNFVGILPNDISGAFIPLTTQPQFEPPEATAPSPGHRAERYYLSTGPNLWQQMMHFQLQFTFATSAAQEEILSWGIFPNESADQPVGQIPAVQGR